MAVQKIKKKSAFKTASDGRLIITEDSSGSEEEEYAHDLDSGKFISVKRITTTPYSETFLMQDMWIDLPPLYENSFYASELYVLCCMYRKLVSLFLL